MVSVPAGFSLAITVLAALTAGGLVGYLFTHRDRAAARSLLGVGLVVLTGSSLHLVVVNLGGAGPILELIGWPADERLWDIFATTETIVASGLWSVFALQYTGRSRRVIRGTTAGVALLSLGAVGVVAVSIATAPSAAPLQLFTVFFLLSGFLVIIGVFLLLWVSVGQNAFPFREPLVLSAGAVVLLSAAFVAQVFASPTLFPALLSVSCGLFFVPVVRYPVFETLPAARVAGRDRVVEELREAVLVVDQDGCIRDLNPAAEALFDVRREAVLEDPLAAVVPTTVDPSELGRNDAPVHVELDDGTHLEITGDRITDQRDRSFGHLLICVDVTDRRRREEQLTLLSRFVADVVRDQVAEIADDASRQAASPDSTTGDTHTADQIWQRTTELTTLVAQTRTVERSIASGQNLDDSRLDLRAQVRAVVESVVDDEGPTVIIDIPDEAVVTFPDAELFQLILEPVLEDAYDHAETQVDIETLEEPALRISDDGPTRDETTARETPGELSLAVARLTLEQLGGEISVATPAADLRRVRVRFPADDQPVVSETQDSSDDRRAVR